MTRGVSLHLIQDRMIHLDRARRSGVMLDMTASALTDVGMERCCWLAQKFRSGGMTGDALASCNSPSRHVTTLAFVA